MTARRWRLGLSLRAVVNLSDERFGRSPQCALGDTIAGVPNFWWITKDDAPIGTVSSITP